MLKNINYKELLKAKEPARVKKTQEIEIQLIPLLENRIPIFPEEVIPVPLIINNVELELRGDQYAILKSILEFNPINEYENIVKNQMLLDIVYTITNEIWSIKKQKGLYGTIQDVIMKKFDNYGILKYEEEGSKNG